MIDIDLNWNETDSCIWPHAPAVATGYILERSDVGTALGDLDTSDFWRYQGLEPACAIVAQSSIIEFLTGLDLDTRHAAQVLESLGLYDPSTGTRPKDCGKLLDLAGLEHVDGKLSISDASSALNHGAEIIALVDSEEMWDPNLDADGHPIEQPGTTGHAIWVTAIDEVGGEDVVVVNDSGRQDGAGRAIAVDVFEEAWDDFSNHAIVVLPQDAHVDAGSGQRD